MKRIERHIKGLRNDTDTQVKKYKQELDVIGIKYDHKSAHVQVPNAGGFEYFKWDWMTSTTGSHSAIVQIFKDVVVTLKAKNNPVQYNSLASNLSANAKSALEATIQSNNITVPQLSQVNDAASLIDPAFLVQKHNIGPSDISGYPNVVKIGVIKQLPDGQMSFELGIVETYRPEFKIAINAYDAVQSGDQQRFNEVYPEVCNSIDGLLYLRNCTYSSTIRPLAEHPSDIKRTAEFIKNSNIAPQSLSSPFSGVSAEQLLKDYTNDVGATVIEMYNEQNMKILDSNTTSEEEPKDDIEVISNILGKEVTLNNGTKIEVKTILKDLSDKEFVSMVLKRVDPNVSKLIEEEIVLKLVYDVQKGLTTKRDVGKIIYSFDEQFDLSDSWLANNNLSIEEIKAKEMEITGGASYLDYNS